MGVSRRLADACAFGCSTHLCIGVVPEKLQAEDPFPIGLGGRQLGKHVGRRKLLEAFRIDHRAFYLGEMEALSHVPVMCSSQTVSMAPVAER